MSTPNLEGRGLHLQLGPGASTAATCTGTSYGAITWPAPLPTPVWRCTKDGTYRVVVHYKTSSGDGGFRVTRDDTTNTDTTLSGSETTIDGTWKVAISATISLVDQDYLTFAAKINTGGQTLYIRSVDVVEV